MSNNIPKYQIDDTVFLSRISSQKVEEVCPICVGEKTVKVIYPNGEEWDIACTTCDTGGFRNYSRGFIITWVYNQILVEKGYIDEVRIGKEGVEYTVKTWYEKEDEDGFHGGWQRQHAKEDRVFDTEEEAYAYQEERSIDKEEEDLEYLMRRKYNEAKSYASSVAHHRKCLADEFRSWQYHNVRLHAMNEQAKRYKKLYKLPEEGK